MRKENRVKLIIITIGIIFAISTNSKSIFIAPLNNNENLETRDKFSSKRPKNSGFWTLNSIHVDNNWSATAVLDWCSGDGSWSNPYVIENVTIDASSSPTGSGIYINNSKSDYFIIRNVTVYNAGSDFFYDAGIKLNNSNNGTLINNNSSNNGGNGFLIYNSENNTMSGNYVNYNKFGIFFSESNNNTFSGNSANYNSYYGIYLSLSNYTTISGNKASNNNEHGIVLLSSNNDNISGNSAYTTLKMGYIYSLVIITPSREIMQPTTKGQGYG